MHTLSRPNDEDWPAILALADVSAPSKIDDNRAWLANRRSSSGRKHHVIARDGIGQLRGFGAAEETSAGWFRVFVVTAPDDLGSAGDEIFRWIEAVCSRQPGAWLWAREEPVDAELVSFLQDRGFTADAPEITPSGQTVILLTKCLG